MSEPKSFHDALLSAQKKIGKVGKNQVNPHFKKAYADYEAVLDAVKGPLNEEGILISHSVMCKDGKSFLVTYLSNANDQTHAESWFPLPDVQNPQQLGSAVTYGKRYNLAAMTGLAIQGDDDDGNSASNPSMTTAELERARMQREAYSTKPPQNPPLTPSKPRGEAGKPVPMTDSGTDWKAVCIHFGRNKDKALGGLTKKTLYGWWANWQPEPWKGKINPADQRLRDALDAAGAHYKFGQPKEEATDLPEEAEQHNQEPNLEEDQIPF